MIEKLELKKIPFVDGIPDKDQDYIDWIINKKDCLTGAEKYGGNDGNLNRTGVKIQKNIVQVQKNVSNVNTKLTETIDKVNSIDDMLTSGSDGDLITTVFETKEKVKDLDRTLNTTNSNLELAELNISNMISDIGVKPSEDESGRDIQNEIYWIKSRIGSFQNEDINGADEIEADPTGIIKTVLDVSAQAADNRRDINEIKATLEETNYEDLKGDVKTIRTELGTDPNGMSVYTRLGTAESTIKENTKSINELSAAIDPNLETRLTTIEQDVKKVSDELYAENNLVDKVKTLTSDTSKLTEEVSTLDIKVDALSTTHSQTDESLKNVKSQVVENTTTISDLSNTIDAHSTSIQSLQSEIGTSKTGLKGAVVDLSTAVNGTNPEGETLEELGLFETTKKLNSRVTAVGSFYSEKQFVVTADKLVQLTLDKTSIAEKCSLLNSSININEHGIFEVSFKGSIKKDDHEVSIVIQSNGKTILEIPRSYGDTDIVFDDSVIVKFNINPELKVFVKTLNTEYSELELNRIRLNIKPIL